MGPTSARKGTLLPPAVTFQTGADLLMELGMVEHITHQGIRYIAEHHPEWPFGEGREHPYWRLANARQVMDTVPFLLFFIEHPPMGCGPAPQQRTPGGES